MERSSLEGGGKRKRRFADIPNRRESFPDRQTLPVTMSFRLLLFGVDNPADCLICAQISRLCLRG